MKHENLINARKEKGFTQKEMADMLAMEQTTYSKKERGISRIRENEWVLFAKILDKDIHQLKRKNKTSTNTDIINHGLYLKIIGTILKFNQKLEDENILLKKQLRKEL
ncbi:helix-turn-helix transcriptional regulator [Flavobacterium psychroterrae]|uniref:Helix-turn-helix transcriptional regulator n=1 Tax=Flavobacterium psychroterrae TaxID=2133767 RepID=A0ABS5P7E5_9FLAO|nr:helix-turn-helix transcriptional regulator [Flavobacterium psychroterrae]MBS7230172.1 helix-turn-helix transcriptional regulator [Flavobacterium psychroterrae]